MRNYFDQKFKTKFSKQTMAGEKEFQWVIEDMENEFEYPDKDVESFDSFFSNMARYSQHILYFIRIYEIDKTELIIENKFVNVLSNIARFAIKDRSISKVMKNNKYKNFTIMYLLGLIASFVQKNRVNGTYDFGMFIYYNWFELHEIKNMSIKNKKNIEMLLNDLTIIEKNKIIDIYSKNYEEVKQGYSPQNLTSLNRYNQLFNNRRYKRNQFCTWQEDYILKMSKLHFSISEIIPQFSSRTWKLPNYDLWDENVLRNMKDFFKHNDDAMTILDIIGFRLHNSSISLDAQKRVLDQAIKIVKNGKNVYDFDNIWIDILIKYLKEKNSYIRNNSNQIFIELKKKRNIQILLFLKENGFGLDRELQNKIDRYCIRLIKKIGRIDNLYTFIDLLSEEYIKKNVNLEMINTIMIVFYDLIDRTENDIQIPKAFYSIINFLIAIKNKNTNELVNNNIFKILKIWKEKYYEKMQSQLQKFEYKTTIKKEEIEIYNQYFVQNSLMFLRNTFSWREQGILEEMKFASEHALATIIKENTIYIDEFVPYIKKIDLGQKDSIENIVCTYIDNLQIKYEEQLLNSNIEPVNYLRSMYERYSLVLHTFISTIDEDNYKRMYEDIRNGFEKYELIPYPEKINVAHITQLIPLVELLIRELGIKNGIIPFKEKEQQIHIMKDSSTVLQNIIRKKYNENNNFDNMSIYLYLYNYLYNNNSLNIRNELIHAREYLDNQGKMRFAFRTIIVGIYWGTLELSI